MKFEWDDQKAISNQRKHGVTFDEASTVFSDFLSITIPDPLHPENEERLVTIGLSEGNLKKIRNCSMSTISRRAFAASTRRVIEKGPISSASMTMSRRCFPIPKKRMKF